MALRNQQWYIYRSTSERHNGRYIVAMVQEGNKKRKFFSARTRKAAERWLEDYLQATERVISEFKADLAAAGPWPEQEDVDA